MTLPGVQLWLPNGRQHFEELLEQARDVVRVANRQPEYNAAMDQAAAELDHHLTQTGVDLRAPGVGEGFMLGALFGMGALEGNPGADPHWLAAGVVAYAIRVVEGPIPPRAQ